MKILAELWILLGRIQDAKNSWSACISADLDDDLEDLYLAERELEAIRSGESQTVPREQVMKRYGMEA